MIPVFKPSYDEKEVNAVKEVLESGWVGLGPKTKEFEDKFAQFIGVNNVVVLNSGTAALDMAMKVLGIGPGDHVLVPTITFVSTAHAVAYQGATPIFVDVDRDTLNIDLEDIKKRITPQTKAIIVVHYGGLPVDLDKLEEIAKEYNIHVVEDCAHASGSYFKGQHVGSRNIGCFSFHAVKNLAMGEGGAISIPEHLSELQPRAKKLRWLGIDKGTWDRTGLDKSYWWEYKVDECGLKSHGNDINSAIGLCQLDKLYSNNNKRRTISLRYRTQLQDIEEIEHPFNDVDTDYYSSWHIYEIKTNKRDGLSVFLKDNGINTGVHYKPIHTYDCYGNKPYLPVSEALFSEILTLPIYPDLSDSDQYFIIRKIREFFGKE